MGRKRPRGGDFVKGSWVTVVRGSPEKKLGTKRREDI